MAEYINKQKALAEIEAEREYMTRRQEWFADHILTHCGYRIIDGMPSEDVEPVRHGRWTWVYRNIRCSECDFAPDYPSEKPMYRYCPNCGARMDGE